MLRRALAIGLAVIAQYARGEGPPTTQPASDSIVEFRLVDPLTPESCCYLDLDKGEVFPRGQTIADPFEARQWIQKNGIDLMCESREPACGLVAYNMAIKPATSDIDHPPEFVSLRRMFDKIDPQQFDFLTPDSLPKTYLFRTSDGALGVLEINTVVENPSGMRIRYRIIHEPPKPAPMSAAQARAQSLARQVTAVQGRVAQFRSSLGDDNFQLLQAERMLDMLQDMQRVATGETNVQLQELKILRIRTVYRAAELREHYANNSEVVVKAQEAADRLTRQINEMTKPPPKVQAPATQKWPQTPVTQPFAEHFHL
jgi:hypothetical protein